MKKQEIKEKLSDAIAEITPNIFEKVSKVPVIVIEEEDFKMEEKNK